MKYNLQARDIKVGDIIYVSNEPRKVLYVMRVPIIKTLDEWIVIYHDMGSIRRRKFSRVRVKPFFIDSIKSDFVLWPIDDDLIIEAKEEIKLEKAIIPLPRLYLYLDKYFKFISQFKQGGYICSCDTLVPRDSHCPHCGFFTPCGAKV